MIEKKIAVGTMVEFGTMTGTRQAAGSGQVTIGAEDRTIIEHKHWFSANEAQVRAGTQANLPNSNFIWLPWADNAINYTESQGKDVLSGPFTGCYMVAYNYNGTRRIGHVATPGAKDAWNALCANDFGHDITAGFRPSATFEEAKGLIKEGGNDGGLITLGLITATDDLYTILAYAQGKGVTRVCRIAAINKVPSMAIADLMAVA